MDQTRKIYQRAVCIPLENLEALWQGYNAFENDLNKTTVKSVILNFDCVGTKVCCRKVSGLYASSFSIATNASGDGRIRSEKDSQASNMVPSRTTGGISKRYYANFQLDMWKNWIEWEKTNPLLQENENAVYTRVIYANKQAMMNMRFYPEIWYILSLLISL